MDKRYVLIDNDEKFQEAVDHLNSVEYVAYDTETTGLNVRKEEVIGFSFTGSVKLGYYLPLYQWNNKTQELEDHPTFNTIKQRQLLDILKTKKLMDLSQRKTVNSN